MDHEDGTFAYPAKQPGGGNPAFRREMRILKEFIHGFEFVRMRPETNRVGGLAEGLSGRALAEHLNTRFAELSATAATPGNPAPPSPAPTTIEPPPIAAGGRAAGGGGLCGLADTRSGQPDGAALLVLAALMLVSRRRR